MKKLNSRAFTMIEFMIVIAIIILLGMLAALALPKLQAPFFEGAGKPGGVTMKTHIEERINLFPHILEEEKTITLRFRVTPSQARLWKENFESLGGKDFSSFARGAIQAAIEMGIKANDPKWQEFIEAIQPIAKKTLGYGIFHGGATVTEGYGKERKGITAEEFSRQLSKNKK